MAEVTIQQALAGGLAQHQAGRLAEAEAIYRQILAVAPACVEAGYLLGIVALQTGRSPLAIEWLARAAAQNPSSAEYACNLGEAYRTAGRLREAVESYHRAIALQPNYPDAFANLSVALAALGELNEAIAACRSAIALKPDFAAMYGNLCEYLRRQGRLEEAVPTLREAIARQPGQAILHHNLGFVLAALGRGDEAVASYRRAIELRPDHADAYFNLANALSDAGWVDEAIAGYERAVALNPQLAGAYVNLGNAHRDAGRLDEAMKCFRAAMRFPTHAMAAHSNVILDMLAHPAYDAKDVLAEAQRWAQAYAGALMEGSEPPPQADVASDRRLRIGYVSADFGAHVVGRALLPVLRAHDRSAFEITCYSSTAKSDGMTAELRQHVDRWRDVAAMPDDQLARQIRDDGIDILIDLSLHLRGNRLLVLARRPGPVQATWLGYPSTTGLKTVDYRLSDPFMDPTGCDEAVYVEKTLRLPDTFQLYGPPDADVAVNELPARTDGVVTFGCLNNFVKVNDSVLGLFSEVLHAVPGSRLILLARRGRHQERTRAFFAERGVDADRILFPDKPRGSAGYLALYHDIDLALDPFPYNGHTTSCDGFWMGVPVVTLVGNAPVGRAGWSQLSNLGLTELAAQTPEEYVAIAKRWAGDLDRLAELRSTLRRRLTQSPLMDAVRFTRAIESTYREMWQNRAGRGRPPARAD